jgi:hypothetical protein
MEILTAFTAMLSDVTHVNASRRQVDGILDWLALTRSAVARAAAMRAPARCLEVTFSGSATHRTWRMSSQDILAALASQAEEARAGRAAAEQEAARRDHLAGLADADAAMARQEAAQAEARAAALEAAGGEAPAMAAQAARAEAGEARQRAAALDAAAVQHREVAARARRAAADYMTWEIAARDAHAAGAAVLAAEEHIAAMVHSGIQAAGGIREVPRDKRYADGGRTALAPAGGN